jgi:ATP-dependent RNA helicase DeaD
MDHLKRGTLKLNELKAVVLDEADEMLRMGFIDDVTWILDQTPEKRQVALFSATMPREIRKVADTYLSNPEIVKIAAKSQTVDSISQQYWLVRGANKLDALTRILEVEDFDAIIMFVRTKTATAELAEKLEARGYATSALNGDMSQQLRERAIERLKNGKIDIIIATDVAARGIDVKRVSHVINYDIPYDTEAYVHRIGRTGRAGRTGKAILFVAPREQRMLHSIERATNSKIERLELPSKAMVADKRINQFKEQIAQAIEGQELDFFREQIVAFAEETQAEPLDIAAALAYMAQVEKPLLQPKDIVEDKPFRERDERGNRDRDRDRDRGSDRGERRPRRERDENMDTYRIEVGHNNHVKPGDIVGAIANEADIDSGNIGHIRIRDDFSLIDLPKGMPEKLLNHLQKVRVRNQPIQISLDKGPRSGGDDKKSFKPRGDRPDNRGDRRGPSKPHRGSRD